MKTSLFLFLLFNILVIQTISATHDNHFEDEDENVTELEKENLEDDDNENDIDEDNETDIDEDNEDDNDVDQLNEEDNDGDENEIENNDHLDLKSMDALYKRGYGQRYYRRKMKPKPKPKPEAETCDLCNEDFTPVGCYGDKHCHCSRPMTRMLFQTKKCHKKMGSAEFKKHVESVICRCAKESRKRGYKAFGIQDHHQCWSGTRAHKDYYINGEQERCFNLDKKICNSTTDRLCIGGKRTNYVYKLEPRKESPVTYSRVGCYADNKEDRALKFELDNHRDKTSKIFHGPIIDWKKFQKTILTLADHCAKKAKDKGYKYFGLQYYGECWAGNDGESRYKMHGSSKACVNSEYKECDVSKDCLCIGKQWTNFVYKIEK